MFVCVAQAVHVWAALCAREWFVCACLLLWRAPCVCAWPRQLLEVQNATQVYFQQLITTLAPKGKYVWNALSGYVQDSWGPVLPLPD